MKVNGKNKVEAPKTHGGAVASNINDFQKLERSVLSCLLWENEHYESGETVAERICSLIPKVDPKKVADLAIRARSEYNLRHVPLLITREMAKLATHKHLVSTLLPIVIQRADELSEFLALYWKGGRQPLSKQVKVGLATAFTKFNEHQLSKYNSDNSIKLKDVLFLCHAKPLNKAQEKLWKKLINNELAPAGTWEQRLSAGEDKKKVFTQLIKDNELGALALLRNLRNMIDAGVEDSVIREGLSNMKTDRVLPFRFISAARYAPQFERELESCMFKNLSELDKLGGKTVLVIDVSGSMASGLSGKSELSRIDAACGLAMLMAETCENVRIYATAGSDYSRIHSTKILPSRRGFALRDSVKDAAKTLGGGGIFLTQCMDYIYEKEKDADRIIVFTDEQDCDTKLNPSNANAFGDRNYLVNIASASNGIGYDKWTHINGFSESVIQYIVALEKEEQNG